MERMRVSTQIALVSFATIVVMVAIGLVSRLNVRALEADADEIAEEWDEMDAIAGALAALRKSRNDPAERGELMRQGLRLAPYLAADNDRPAEEHEKRETRLFAHLERLLRRAVSATPQELETLTDEALEVALSFWHEDLGRVPERLSTLRARQRRLRSLNLATGFGLLLVPTLVLVFIQWRIARPLARIQANVARIAGGEAPGQRRVPTMARLENEIAAMVSIVEARRKDLEAQVETRTVQLRHADRLGGLGRIASAVAHEINTPLGSIDLCLQGLQSELAEEQPSLEQLRDYLTTAAAQVESCTATTRKLLSYAHLQPQEPRIGSVSNLVHEAVELVGAHCRQRGVTVDLELAEPAPEVTGDLAQLRQVLVNLILNAADASPRGAHVRVATARADGHVTIDVKDRGKGVPADLRSEIFSPFFTTKRLGEGTGLGLSIAREIIEAHGGELTFADQPEGSGSVFRIDLPGAEA